MTLSIMTFSKTTLSIMTFSIAALSIMAFSITTHSIMTFSKTKNVMLSITALYTYYCYAECHLCCESFMLSLVHGANMCYLVLNLF